MATEQKLCVCVCVCVEIYGMARIKVNKSMGPQIWGPMAPTIGLGKSAEFDLMTELTCYSAKIWLFCYNATLG